MKLLGSVSVLLLIFFSKIACAQSPVDVVRQATFASMDESPNDLPWYEPVANRFFTKGLQAALGKVGEFEGCNYWDANIISGRQGQDSVTIIKSIELVNTGVIAVVKATLKLSIDGTVEKPIDQEFILRSENSHWKIDELIFDDAKGPADYDGTLHSYIRSLGNNNCH